MLNLYKTTISVVKSMVLALQCPRRVHRQKPLEQCVVYIVARSEKIMSLKIYYYIIS